MSGWMRFVPSVALVLAAGAVIAFLTFRYRVLTELGPALEAAVVYRPPGTVQILDREGEVIDRSWQERRVWVTLDSLPATTWGAIVSAEDRRFFDHSGVDLWGVARAAVSNVLGGTVNQGASTLTQQLVKNLIVGDERTYTRKAREAVVAWELERRLTKEQILELYVNYVYLGSLNYGVEAAAHDYFGVGAAELSPGQAATLASVIPAPSRLDPRVSPERTLQRRNRVLAAMAETGLLGPLAAKAAMEHPLRVLPAGRGERGGSGAAYATAVRRQLTRELGPDEPFALGLQVHTAMDPAVQAVAEEAVASAAKAVMKRQGLWAIARHLRRRADRSAFVAAGEEQVAGDCFEAMLTSRTRLASSTAQTWRLASGERSRRIRQRDREEGPPSSFGGVARIGDVVRVCAVSSSTVVLNPDDWVQGAAVVIDHATGEVLALVGGTEPVLEGFVRATQARRQPGSTFKPIVMAAALQAGRSQRSVVVDGPVSMPAGDGTTWRPTNAGGYRGAVSLRTALAASLNAVSAKLTRELGVDIVAATARRMGIRTPLREVPSLALGSSEVTVLDQAAVYATIANGGMWREPRLVRRVDDREHAVRGAAGTTVRGSSGAPIGVLPGRIKRALPSGVAAEVADMLHGVVENGTGRSARRKGLWRAGKTGTTNDATDAWFAGFTPRYTVVVWIGADDNGSLGSGESGSRTALPAWSAIVDALPAAVGEEPPLPPDAKWIRRGDGWIVARRPGF